MLYINNTTEPLLLEGRRSELVNTDDCKGETQCKREKERGAFKQKLTQKRGMVRCHDPKGFSGSMRS